MNAASAEDYFGYLLNREFHERQSIDLNTTDIIEIQATRLLYLFNRPHSPELNRIWEAVDNVCPTCRVQSWSIVTNVAV